MDPFTHAALGATVAVAGFRRSLGRRAIVAGALVGMVPDLDVVAGWVGGPFAAWVHHRGLTHSVFFAAVAGPAIGWGLWRFFRWRRAGAGPGADRAPGASAALLPWMGLALAVLLTHPLIDLITHYGTQLLAPLSRQRFAIPAMPIIDPLFTLILLAAVVLGLLLRNSPRTAQAAAVGALTGAWTYVLFAWSLNAEAEATARAQLAAAGVRAAEVHAYPTIFQPYYRRIVARTPDKVLVGFHSALAPRPIEWTAFAPGNGSAVAAVAATPQAAVLEWFAMGQVLWRVEDGQGLRMVEATDLRYGLPGSERGFWGIRAPVGPDGRPLAPPSIFTKRPPLNGDKLARLWSLVFG